MNIFYSILIPVYNVEKYLDECINSILKQKYRYFEVILVDDGSTDASSRICDYYVEKDCRIKVIHQQNMGLIAARRIAIANSKGDFCLFLDSDDYWEEDMLDTINNTIINFECDMVIFNYYKVIGNRVMKNKPIIKNNTIFSVSNKAELFRILIENSNINSLCLKAVKRSIIDFVDYSKHYGLKHSEDLLQSLPLMYNAKKIIYINNPLYYYRSTENSITKSVSEHKFEDISISRALLFEYMGKLGINNNEDVKKFYLFYCKSILNNISCLVMVEYSSEKIIETLKQIKKIQLFINASSQVKWYDLPLSKRLSFLLLNNNQYNLLIMYEKFMFSIKQIGKYFLGKGH